MLSKAVSIMAALVILSTARPVQGTAGNAIAKTHWEPLCKISKNLAGYYNTQETKIPKAIKADLDHIREELKLRILIERSDPQEALKLLPLLAAANNKHYLAPTTIDTGIQAALKATRDVAFLHGHVTEFLTLAASAHSSGGSHGCLQDTLTAVTGQTGLTACGMTPADGPVPTAPGFGYTPKEIFGAKTSAHSSGGLTHSSLTCALTKGQTSNGILAGQTVATKVPYAAGYFYIHADWSNLGRHQIEGSDGGTDDTEAAFWTKARIAIKNAEQQASSFKTAEHSLPSLQDIKDSPAAKTAIKNHILNKAGKYNPDVDDTDTNKKADELYGDQKSYSQTKIWDQMKSISIDRNIYNKDLDQDQKLSDITDINHLRQILTYYQGQRAAELAAKTKELQKTTENSQCKVSTVQDKDKVCNTKGKDDQGECEKLESQGCVFNKDGKDGEKCTLSEERKQQSSTSSSSRLFQTVCQQNRNDSGRHNKPGKTSGSSLH
uniref:Variant surface glycoprotein 738 n=1 Tax=Trypanosoma brucei TaxID=5691 RepID=M4SXA6_9TRYP|nr:variant surface glycoprotein 738 [Trypanosoma brucei]